ARPVYLPQPASASCRVLPHGGIAARITGRLQLGAGTARRGGLLAAGAWVVLLDAWCLLLGRLLLVHLVICGRRLPGSSALPFVCPPGDALPESVRPGPDLRLTPRVRRGVGGAARDLSGE